MEKRNPVNKSIIQVAESISKRQKEYDALPAKKRNTKAGKGLAAAILAGKAELNSLIKPIKKAKPEGEKN